MKNRSLLLCLKNGIETVEEYAMSIGVSIDHALGILKETDNIEHNIVMRNCELFKVTPDYFLCLTEN